MKFKRVAQHWACLVTGSSLIAAAACRCTIHCHTCGIDVLKFVGGKRCTFLLLLLLLLLLLAEQGFVRHAGVVKLQADVYTRTNYVF